MNRSLKYNSSGVIEDRENSLRNSYDQDISTLRKLLKSKNGDNLNRSYSHSHLHDSYNENNSFGRKSYNRDLNYSNNILNLSDTAVNGGQESLNKIKSERDELLKRFRLGEASSVSIKERQELENQLQNIKEELFYTNKRAKEKFEDFEEKFEQTKCALSEKISDKDITIESLSKQIENLKLSQKVRAPSYECSTQTVNEEQISVKDLEILDKELKNMEIKFIHSRKQFEKSEEKLREEIDRTKLKLKKSEKGYKELSEKYSDANSIISKLSKTLKDKESESSKMEELSIDNKNIMTENERLELELNSMKKLAEIDRLKYKKLKSSIDSKQKRLLAKLEPTIKELKSKNTILQNKLNGLNNVREEIDQEKEKFKKEMKSNEDYLISENSTLENKLAFVQKELAESLEKNSRLESSIREKERKYKGELDYVESKLNNELNNLKNKLDEAEKELVATKANQRSNNREEKLYSIIQEECNKLSILCNTISPATKYNSERLVTKSDSLTSKKSILDLQDAVETVCRGSNELYCEVLRLRRERNNSKTPSISSKASSSSSSRTSSYNRSSYSSNLRSSKTNFGSYDSLLLKSCDYGDSAYSSSNNAWRRSSEKVIDESSTAKLLSRLQGRVKQLRSDRSYKK